MIVEQTTRWRRPDGTLSALRADAAYIPQAQVLELARLRLAELAARRIDHGVAQVAPGFVLGIGIRETNLCANEIDTDYRGGQPLDLRTYGLLQLNPLELRDAVRLGALVRPDADLCDPSVNIAAGVALFESMLARILDAAHLAEPTPDTWPYLAWAHNAGIGEPIRSIAHWGLDWPALTKRPENLDPQGYVCRKLIPYASAACAAALAYPL